MRYRFEENKAILTTYDTSEIAMMSDVPIEVVLAYMILKAAHVMKFISRGVQYSELYTESTEGHVFDFSRNKIDARHGFNNRDIGDRARTILRRSNVPENAIIALQKDLNRCKLSVFEKIVGFIKSNIAPFLSGLLIGLVANYISQRLFKPPDILN